MAAVHTGRASRCGKASGAAAAVGALVALVQGGTSMNKAGREREVAGATGVMAVHIVALARTT